MLIILGHIITDPAHVHALAEDLRAGVPRTLREDGCLFYSFALEDPAAGRILAAERWRDQAALDAHLSTPAVVELMEKWAGKFEIEVLKYDAANERGLAD